MVKLLAKWFIKDHNDISSPDVRRKYGMLCGGFGIFLNFILFGIKLFAGIISSSIAITADAFNNLSDAGSSAVTMIGFKLAGQKPDGDHPFGHGRFEYISALIVSFIIIIMGFELGKSSVEKIINPEPVEFSIIAIAILCISILTKVYMFLYNRGIGKKLHSEAMRATAFDSLSDTVATAVVLICMLISRFTGLKIDGWCGVVVALFIIYAGISTIKDTISSILGKPADPELVQNIENIVRSYPEVVGIHDLIVHDYGPGRCMISLHAEVSENADIRHSHDTIDNIERRLQNETGCNAVIHMDPIAADDEQTIALKAKTSNIIKAIDPRLSIHDFRIVAGTTHTNLIFDLVVPFDKTIKAGELRKAVEKNIKQLGQNYYAVVTIDRSFV